jgi:hypothetical protein
MNVPYMYQLTSSLLLFIFSSALTVVMDAEAAGLLQHGIT